MTPTLTFTSNFHVDRGGHGRLQLRPQAPAAPAPAPAPAGRVPRISRLMALAIRFDEMLRRGDVKDLAELARLGHVTRARATQILNLTMLAPDLQQALLFLPPTCAGRDTIKEWQVRPVAAESVWAKQRRMWRKLTTAAGPGCTAQNPREPWREH
jgi:hypothetical protein